MRIFVLGGFFRAIAQSVWALLRAVVGGTYRAIRSLFTVRPTVPQSVPWHENRVVKVTAGPLAAILIGLGLKFDIGWMLILAWGLGVILTFAATFRFQKKLARVIITAVVALPVGFGMYRLYLWQAPSIYPASNAHKIVSTTPMPTPPKVQTGPNLHGKGTVPLLTKRAPSRSFVYVAPGFWSPEPVPRWGMIIKHAGPDPVFNIELLFVDKDRQVALSKNRSVTPQDIGAMQKTLRFPEIDPIVGVWAKIFFWPPLKPDNEHYEVTVASREGVFSEMLGIKRASVGKWQYRMKVTDSESHAVLINCRDPEFPGHFLASRPPCFPQYVVGQKSHEK